MAYYINGTEITKIYVNKVEIPNAFYVDGNRITLGTGVVPPEVDYTFEDAEFTFSVNQNGVVSFGNPNGVTITAQTYTNGQSLGMVATSTTRTQNVTFTAPSGANVGDSISGNLAAIQGAVSRPSVTTNSSPSQGGTSATLSGTVTSDGGSPILEKGFYIAQGSGLGPSFIRNFGNYIYDSNSGTGGFTENASGLSGNTTYSYVAFARNIVGTTIGGAVELTTTAVQAQADYIRTYTGAVSGGTAGTPIGGDFGDWTGAADIVFDSSDNPIEASCSADQELCTLRRERTTTVPYTGGVRTDELTCSIIIPGAGTPRCSSPDNPVGAVIEQDVTGVSYSISSTEEQTTQVTNSSFNSAAEFTEAAISVVSCGVSADGTSGFVNTNFGTATVTNLPLASNPSANSRLVTVRFSVTVNASELDSDDWIIEQDSFTFHNLSAQCSQAGQPLEAPTFNANSASVTAIGSAGNVPDGDIFVIEGSGGTYNVSAPTGTGGTVQANRDRDLVEDFENGPFGSGSYTIGPGDTNVHSFRISNSQGEAVYTFRVEASE